MGPRNDTGRDELVACRADTEQAGAPCCRYLEVVGEKGGSQWAVNAVADRRASCAGGWPLTAALLLCGKSCLMRGSQIYYRGKQTKRKVIAKLLPGQDAERMRETLIQTRRQTGMKMEDPVVLVVAFG
jgi:hypothetical protein